MVLLLGAGSGWVAETVITARQRADSWAQTSDYNRAQLLPHTPRDALGAVMDAVAEGDTSAACSVFSDAARAQLAAAWGAGDCAAAVLAWHARVTRPADYTASVELSGVTTTTSPDRETATVTGCALAWSSPIDGRHPDAGPSSPGRMALRRILGQGYQITDYRPC